MGELATAAAPVHPGLAASSEGRPLADARLTDRERLAVLLQGAALLAHCEIAGWRLEGGWDDARLAPGAVLCGLRATPGRAALLPQEALARLVARLFGGDLPPAGPGQARGAVRRLLRRWCCGLLPLPPDVAVGHLAEASPFLWWARFGEARTALAAEHRGDDRRRVWVAGPGWFRRAVLARSTGDLSAVHGLLRSAEAGKIWRRGRGGSVSGSGRPGDRLLQARRLCGAGRYRSALHALHRQRGAEARVLRLRATARLGRTSSARRLLASLEKARLERSLLLQVAETAVQVLGNAGDSERAGVWVRRARAAAGPGERSRAELLAAAAAWDRGDLEATERGLRLARPARDEARLAWRWHHLRGLAALARGDAAAAVEQLREALRRYRRSLRPPQAARLWNELGIGRALAGDLAGAERALRHAVRLLQESDGPQRCSLAVFNLAELRLRQGEPRGVRQIAERAAERDRRLGNWRAWAHDQELRIRVELTRGRPAEALEAAERTLELLDRRRLGWQRPELHAQAARALGWLGRRREAREHLERISPVALRVFEPEERPALWLHAGDRRRAARAVAEAPEAALWRPLLAGEPLTAAEWRRLEALGSYRSARWVYDVERALPGALPLERVRLAAARLRRLGARSQAEQLTAREEGAWSALGAYLRAPAPGVEEVRRLLTAAGAAAARLSWCGAGEERVLIGGSGGPVELTARCGRGRLRLQVGVADPALQTIVELAARDLETEIGDGPAPATASGPTIVGASRALRSALERVDRLAPREVPIVIEGETGTGKELVARRIHARSRRRLRPLLAVNCAALPRGLLLSELFGHRRGSFTGADRDRAGIFESGDGGTVFLDEIGDLPAEAQGSLLRVLQEGEVRRVGENRPRRVDVRIVAATHRDLAAMVERGEFRRDLFYRLGGATIRLPPLRERGGDVVALSRRFLAELEPGRRLRLSKRAREALLGHSWPGNVRELRNKLRVAAALADGVIRPEHLDLPLAAKSGGLYHHTIEQVRVQLVRDALAAAEGNQAAAARRLGITRQAFSYLVRKFELS